MNRRSLSAGLLFLAFAISILGHGLLLLVPGFKFAPDVEPPRLIAELRSLPEKLEALPALSVPAEPVRASDKKRPARKKLPKPKKSPSSNTPTVIAAPLPEVLSPIVEESIAAVETVGYALDATEGGDGGSNERGADEDAFTQGAPVLLDNTALRLPTRGTIHYRVDRGDSNFEVGRAINHWRIAAGRYHLVSVVETTGLVWLFKSLHIEMESKGFVSPAGLRPETFVIRQRGKTIREWALLDWAAMKVKVGELPEMNLLEGTQDLLSFNFQLGFIAQSGSVEKLPIVTGKKYREYGVQVLGKEEIELPVGVLQTIHIRAPGENMTELWLAYDYLLLPVKIRHVDKKGDVLVQVATAILLGEEAETFD